MLPELRGVERPSRQSTALQDPVLRLVIIVRALILLDGFFERDHIAGFFLDQNLDARAVNRRGDKCVDARADEDEQECGYSRPSSLVEHAQVIADVHLASAAELRIALSRQGRAG